MGKPLVATLTFWGTVAGTALALSGRRRAGGLLLLTVGYGGLGIAWDRGFDADLRRLGIPPRPATFGALTHLPQAVAGTWLLSHGGVISRDATRPPVASSTARNGQERVVTP